MEPVKVTETPKEIKSSQEHFDRWIYMIFCKYIPKGPKGDKSFLWRIFKVVKLSIYFLLLLNSCIWLIYEAITMEISDDQVKFSYIMVYLGATYQAMWKNLVSLKYRNELKNIRRFMKELEDSLKTGDLTSEIRRQELPKELSLYVLFSKTYFRTTLLATFIVCGFNSYTTKLTSPMMITIPYLHWTLNFILQLVSVAPIFVMIVGSDILLNITVGYLVGELATITKLASKINEEDAMRKKNSTILRNVYLLHMRVLQVINELRKIYWQLSLHIILGMFFMICLFIYTARYLPFYITDVFLLCNCTLELIIICFICQVLLDSTEGVGDALWQSNWYELNVEDQKRFLFILRMAQIPKGINASDLTIISLNTLVQVLKTALSFTAFLYTTIN